MEIRHIIGCNDYLARIIGFPLLAMVIPPFFFAIVPEFSLEFLVHCLICMVFVVIIWEGNRAIFIRFSKKFSDPGQIKRRLARQIPLHLGYTLVIGFGLNYFAEQICTYYLEDSFEATLFQKLGSFIFPTALCLAIYEGLFYLKTMQSALLEAEELRRENLASQLEFLKNQVKPHFLFNSLNVLVGLIPENPDQAMDYVRKLSKVYRYILDIQSAQTVSLARELDALQAYTFLQKMRLGDTLKEQIDLDPSLLRDYAIAPLSLQMLMENAVNHNIATQSKPLSVSLKAENGWLVFSNNFQPKQQKDTSTGLGLNNIRQRYHLLGAAPVTVACDDNLFTVRLPLIPLPVYAGFNH